MNSKRSQGTLTEQIKGIVPFRYDDYNYYVRHCTEVRDSDSGLADRGGGPLIQKGGPESVC